MHYDRSYYKIKIHSKNIQYCSHHEDIGIKFPLNGCKSFNDCFMGCCHLKISCYVSVFSPLSATGRNELLNYTRTTALGIVCSEDCLHALMLEAHDLGHRTQPQPVQDTATATRDGMVTRIDWPVEKHVLGSHSFVPY